MQRQLAIQRLQEQEKERQMRLEQQKHTIQMRAQMPAFSLPYAQVHNAYSITCSLNWVQCGCFAIEIKWMTNVWMCCHADAVFAAQCGRRGGVPARSSTQLPGNLQPRWFCGGFAYAQHLYEPAWAVGTTTVPSHARSCHRWGGQQEDTWRELNTFWWLTFWKNLTCKCKTLIQVFFFVFSLLSDPNMHNAYMYQPAGTNGQPPPPPGQAPPTTSPPYSNYQPTPTQGYQVWLTPTIIF